MKKTCIPLFVISIFSLLISVFTAINYIVSINTRTQLSTIDRTNENSVPLAFAQVGIEVDLFFLAVIFAATLILGTFGLIGSIKKGRLSILCIILDSLPLAYIFFGVIFFFIRKSNLYKGYMLILLFLALYMAGAIIAFKGREKLKK